jgi:septal ring factor EnvC (AmiA/AmiB activator)
MSAIIENTHSSTVRARVLVEGAHGKVDDVIEIAVEKLDSMKGVVDAHPAAVAYAESLIDGAQAATASPEFDQARAELQRMHDALVARENELKERDDALQAEAARLQRQKGELEEETARVAAQAAANEAEAQRLADIAAKSEAPAAAKTKSK